MKFLETLEEANGDEILAYPLCRQQGSSTRRNYWLFQRFFLSWEHGNLAESLSAKVLVWHGGGVDGHDCQRKQRCDTEVAVKGIHS